MRRARPAADRFWEKVQKSDGCWEWTGCVHPNGYGMFVPTGPVPVGAHRFAWTLTYGPITGRLFVCHHCDNKKCVRPDHLFLGTNRDNMLDFVAKGFHHLASREVCRRGHALPLVAPGSTGKRGRRCRECQRQENAKRKPMIAHQTQQAL